MLKWTERNGKITANRAWVMTEAWAIVKRFQKMGHKKTISEALKMAWWGAKMEVSVQISARGKKNQIAELAKLGQDRLRQMENDIENIDRHSDAVTKRLSDIRAALRIAA
jgi:hypothetical protein